MSVTAATPWVEKYRPKSLDDISHQTEVVATLQNAVRTNRLPHLLFYGPPGTGKTSVALALCRTLWHPTQWKRRVLELNASDERGISVVRDKIKHFASLSVGTSSLRTGDSFFGSKKKNEDSEEDNGKSYPNPPFKIIVLDEADTVTPDAQAALRRVIEAHSKITRFILICNYVTRIIEPLASRCAKFRFQPLPPSTMKERFRYIARAEGCRFSNAEDGDKKEMEEQVLNEILNLSQGDMRRAVTTLQSAHALSFGSHNGIIVKESIAEMAGLPPSNLFASLLTTLQAPNASFDQMESKVMDLIAEGYAAQHIFSALLQECIQMENSKLSEGHKAQLAIQIAQADKNLVDGADEVLQLLLVCSLALRCFLSRANEISRLHQ